jgi:hypothetical protein
MPSRVLFKGVYPVGDMDRNALPVEEIGPAIEYDTQVLGFSPVMKERDPPCRNGMTPGLGFGQRAGPDAGELPFRHHR